MILYTTYVNIQLEFFKKEDYAMLKIIFFVKIADQFYQGSELRQSPPILNFPYASKSSTVSIFLIGLDGGIKQQWNQLILPNVVFQKIDAMPMRISESKQKSRRIIILTKNSPSSLA